MWLEAAFLRYSRSFFLVFLAFLSPGLSASAAGSSVGVSPNKQALQRSDYGQATAALRRGGGSHYEQLRSSLDNYPLAIYLDYYKLSGWPAKVRPAEARQFIDRSQDTPLPNRFLGVYLARAGKDRRWQDFLQVMPDEPNSIELKCYYLRAKLASGDTTVAWEGAERLWVYGKSRPKACDPLFRAWLSAGELTDPVVWARLLEAFEARQRSLLSYVAKKGSAELAPWSDKLLAVYAKPQRMQRQLLPGSSPYSSDIASYGVAYLARYSPRKALKFWQEYQGQLSFTEAQRKRAEHAIALRSLYAKTNANIPWLEQALPRIGDDTLVEIRLRWALAEQDWPALARTLSILSDGRADDAAWRYWRAVALEHMGQREQAQSGLAALALERGYYSFLAADKLGKPYAFNNSAAAAMPLLASVSPVAQLPAVVRIEELYFHEEDRSAHSEWFKVLQNSDAPRQESLASYASQQGWHRLAIDGANQAKAWDRLDLRFPTPYQDIFNRYASLQNIPSTELMAIARRESAFFPAARSSAGARGLMQLMPATGKQVARSLGEAHQQSDLYEVGHNVLLGSAYYRQLLDRYNGNRVFAVAAYNAGPHRVDLWRNKKGKTVPVEIWAATIPFRETRNYVQAVLSYNVVFHHLLGVERSLLTAAELQAAY